MLNNIDPILTPDLLWILAAMGHGDEICVCDANFPATAVAGAHELVRLPGVDSARAVTAILSLLPLDSFVDSPVRRMQVVGDPMAIPPVQREVQAALDRAHGAHVHVDGLERFAFYEAAREAFAVVQTGEERGYGCFLIRKGVILAAD